MISGGCTAETIPLNCTSFQSCLAIEQGDCWTNLNFATKIINNALNASCCEMLPGCFQALPTLEGTVESEHNYQG